MSKKIDNQAVVKIFNQYPAELKHKLLSLRQLIIDTADSLEQVGELEETIKWGQPSFVTRNPKTGSTIRIDAVKNNSQQYAVYFHCQTNLVDTFRQMYPQTFNFSGKRALIFNQQDDLPVQQLSHCIALALTYHLNK